MKTSFSTLPDYMPSAELEKYFKEFICFYKDTNEIVKSLEELDELADRQWHTYELISYNIKKEIEEYLITIIDYEDYEIIDWLLVIIPKLGLEEIYNLVLRKQIDIKNTEVIKIINEAKAEYGENVSNPYSGM